MLTTAGSAASMALTVAVYRRADRSWALAGFVGIEALLTIKMMASFNFQLALFDLRQAAWLMQLARADRVVECFVMDDLPSGIRLAGVIISNGTESTPGSKQT
jgi:hypothetical protein